MGKLFVKRATAARGRSSVAAVGLLALSLTLTTLSGCAWLDQKQRQLIYRPTPLAEEAALPAGVERLVLPVPHAGAMQRMVLWWLPQADPAAPTLLYLHGTLRNLQGNRGKIAALHQAGFAILAADYRGWGQSSPIIPCEASINADARMAWDELTRREPRAGMRVIYGHSMGSGVAVTLASGLDHPRDYGGLILESAFSSFADIAEQAGFWAGLAARFTNERFASIERIGQVNAPLLVLHGAQDRTVPLALGERLFAAARAPKQWVALDRAGHSDLHRSDPAAYQSALRRFHQLLRSDTP